MFIGADSFTVQSSGRSDMISGSSKMFCLFCETRFHAAPTELVELIAVLL